MTLDSSLRLLDALQQNNSGSTPDGEEVSLLFQLLRQGDLSMSMAWLLIWHESEKTP